MKNSSKGFSLVELIVVIAIMAILVGVLAPSLMSQIDKSKVSKDKQTLDAIKTAVETAMTDCAADDTYTLGSGSYTLTALLGYTATDSKNFSDALKANLKGEDGTTKFTCKKLKTQTLGTVAVKVDDYDNVEVSITSTTDSSFKLKVGKLISGASI